MFITLIKAISFIVPLFDTLYTLPTITFTINLKKKKCLFFYLKYTTFSHNSSCLHNLNS